MKENKSVNEQQEQVIITPTPRIIKINRACQERAYGLFDSRTGTQVSDFIKGTNSQVEFKDLDPNRHYDVGVIENTGDEKPYFAIAWNRTMRDDTDAILKNSDNLPVVYPAVYSIKDNKDNPNGIFDLVDKDNEPVGQVIKLSPMGDKPNFRCIHSMKLKDDTKE